MNLTKDVAPTASKKSSENNESEAMNLTKDVAPTASKKSSKNNESDKGCGPNSEQKELRKQ
jgi:hypothetical protein